MLLKRPTFAVVAITMLKPAWKQGTHDADLKRLNWKSLTAPVRLTFISDFLVQSKLNRSPPNYGGGI